MDPINIVVWMSMVIGLFMRVIKAKVNLPEQFESRDSEAIDSSAEESVEG